MRERLTEQRGNTERMRDEPRGDEETRLREEVAQLKDRLERAERRRVRYALTIR